MGFSWLNLHPLSSSKLDWSSLWEPRGEGWTSWPPRVPTQILVLWFYRNTELKLGFKAFLQPADCGQQKLRNCWNSAEEKWIPTTSDWELLPFISENHHCLPGFWHPGIQISSLLWCLRDNNSWKKENPSVYGVRPCFLHYFNKQELTS